MSDQSINPVFLIDPLNSKCADCQTGDAAFVSVNNGILICSECAQKHATLGYQISYIRDLKEELDSYLYKFVELGGNTRFKDYLASVNLTEITDFDMKYKCAAVDYYRRSLKCKVLNLGELAKDFNNPLLVPEGNRNCFDEFESYVSVKRMQQLRGTVNAGNKVGGFFKFIGSKVVTGVTTAGKFVGEKAIAGKNLVVEKGGVAVDKVKKTFTKKENSELNEVKEDESQVIDNK